MGNLLQGFGGTSSGGLDPAGIFPDNAFRVGGVGGHTTLSPEQQRLLGPLADYISGELGSNDPNQQALLARLMGSTTAESKAMSERIFEEALLGPAMRAYNRDVAPAVKGDYAGIGGTLSSRRDLALTQGRTEVVNNATSALAGILPQIQSFPLEQTLRQIQGLEGLQKQKYTPFQNAMQFALSPTRQNIDESAGPGWGVLQSFIGAV